MHQVSPPDVIALPPRGADLPGVNRIDLYQYNRMEMGFQECFAIY